MDGERLSAESAWAPLSYPVFRALWISSLVSNIGTWMQNVGAAWAMTSLSPSPLMVALVQSATSLPVFLVGLPAGAVADIVDRRRLLLVTQTWMLAAAALLAVLAFVDLMTPTTLLVLTFALGIGVAMNTPTWQYRVDPFQTDAFVEALGDLEPIRRRDGAVTWAVYEDPGQKGRYVESFVVESWLEHLRQHERATVGDRTVQERIRRFHIAGAPPSVTHLIAAKFTRP